MNEAPHTLVFVCTGNYYRSRFAEAVFNHFAQAWGMGWRAVSRGLDINAAPDDPLSPHTAEAMIRLGLARSLTGADRTPLREEDLRAAQRVIALKEAEHYPMMVRSFPDWAERIDYWGIHDLDCAGPETALRQIYSQVEGLAAELCAYAPPGDVRDRVGIQ